LKQDFVVDGDKIIVTLSGSMHVEDAGVLRTKLLECTEQGSRFFLIDMAGLDYLDSTGLGVLVTIHKRALQNNGVVTLRGLSGRVKELFELTRLNKVFQII